MPHALIIDDNMVVSRAVEDRLIPIGFDSFDHTWTAPQAIRAAERRPPDLIVLSEDACGPGADRLADEICMNRRAPVVLIAGASCRLFEPDPQHAAGGARFPLSDIDRAVELAYHAVCPGRAA